MRVLSLRSSSRQFMKSTVTPPTVGGSQTRIHAGNRAIPLAPPLRTDCIWMQCAALFIFAAWNSWLFLWRRRVFWVCLGLSLFFLADIHIKGTNAGTFG